MHKSYSIAEAKNRLSTVVRVAEQVGPVELTRRGLPVAVVIGREDYERMNEPRATFQEVLRDLRHAQEHDPVDLDPDEIFEGVEDRSPGRDVSF